MLIGILGSNVLGLGVGTIVGAAVGVAIGLAIGETADVIASGAGGFLGTLSAAAVVHGALRGGGTRLGIAAYLGVLGICLVVP